MGWLNEMKFPGKFYGEVSQDSDCLLVLFQRGYTVLIHVFNSFFNGLSEKNAIIHLLFLTGMSASIEQKSLINRHVLCEKVFANSFG